MPNSIGKPTACKPPKPAKPYADFPLYAHASKRWAKKIRGRTHFFGKWDDWQAALERYQYEVDYLQQGKTPPPQNQDALTVGELVNSFLEHREGLVNSGELAQRTWDDYKRAGAMLVASLGRHTSCESLTASDFQKLRAKLSKRLGLVSLGNEIRRSRAILNFAFKNDLIDRPIKTGVSFDLPDKASLKREKETKPQRIFTIEDLQTLYQKAGRQMQCFMLLALNGGLGNADIGLLKSRHIQNGWLNYPRPKTMIERRFPLWAETITAIEEARQTKRPDLEFVFVTKYAEPWYRSNVDDPLAKEFYKLCIECKLHKKGRGFYSLRHQFRTIADGCRDSVAIDRVMGHADSTMGAGYREWLDDARLQAVVDYVRQWCLPMFDKVAK